MKTKKVFFIQCLYGKFVAKSFKLDEDRSTYLLELENKNKNAICPHCKSSTSFVHSRTKRTVIDTINERIIKVSFTSRKFKCKNCNKIFTELIPFVIGKMKYSARIVASVQEAYSLYKSNGKGSRLTTRFFYLDSLIHNIRIPEDEMKRMLKVDGSIVYSKFRELKDPADNTYEKYGELYFNDFRYDENVIWNLCRKYYHNDYDCFLADSPNWEEKHLIESYLRRGKAIEIEDYHYDFTRKVPFDDSPIIN